MPHIDFACENKIYRDTCYSFELRFLSLQMNMPTVATLNGFNNRSGYYDGLPRGLSSGTNDFFFPRLDCKSNISTLVRCQSTPDRAAIDHSRKAIVFNHCHNGKPTAQPQR
ncbi:unnamed protein product [Fusarium graminearum]|uniref:Chromosome 3, complete genome n=1 Tax=Gibberella zeae (strain ATCC MYA-4620 / CBS 123657 / FGSC 9075 / NRRL 31084 / PH-1) TaxID=229533 RepID=I1SAJ1_GIBZE|nr:hypothetical protein FGSG_13872 [Fusarium graminearum PH-1]ESU17725.1 hypothetical protein FGSG_13872 [Fusarium graminearum PH-1]CEF87133.1 unnamed protein product [Fusarium graminearum]CZS85613.1 unnamed protein product [Fusarium graminearum]|eukprot:XP_011325347.1 hypothetical protein FGSG_13872 [Fusarium graminearum PH-1]